MGDVVFNVARGRVRFYYDAVKDNIVATSGFYTTTANSTLAIVVIDRGATTDDAMADFDTLADIIAGTPNEVTNTGYARKFIPDSELATSAVNDTTNLLELDVPDQTWLAVASGSSWTDILVCFKPDAASADSAIIPLVCIDFPRTPSGLDITWSVPAAGFVRSL